jgi:hypothetical protein
MTEKCPYCGGDESKCNFSFETERCSQMEDRDIAGAADRLMRADDEELKTIARHDPSMIRDVAAAFKSGPAQCPDLAHAVRAIIDANNDFRAGMSAEWEGDPLQDAINEAAKLLLPSAALGNSVEPVRDASCESGVSETTPTKAEFAEWSRVWNGTCNTMLEMLGLPGHGSPDEMITQLRAYLEGRVPSPALSGSPGGVEARTCASCHAILANGPQPAATYTSRASDAVRALPFVIEYCRRMDGCGWAPMAAFDTEGAANSYLEQQRTDQAWPWIYRRAALPDDGRRG